MPDVTPPESTVISPTPGTAIEADTPIVLDVTDETGLLRRVLLGVTWQAGALAGVTELVYDGDAFLGYYGGSSRTVIANGFRYTLRRSGGWLASPTVRVFAFDRGGNEIGGEVGEGGGGNPPPPVDG